MTQRILVLHEGNVATGTRGGDVYAHNLLTQLRKHSELVFVNREALGVAGIVVSGAEYARRLEKHLDAIQWRAPVLHDGSAFYQMPETNHMLKRQGWGPIVSLLQEWLPAREESFRGRLHLNRYMFRFVHGVDAHVAVSTWLKRRLMRFGVRDSSIDVARPGVPVQCFESAKLERRTASSVLRIVCAGVYHPSKGQLLLVEAMGVLAKRAPEQLKHYQVNMYGKVMPGNEPYFERVQKRVAELGLESIVVLNGQIDQQQLWSTFASSDVFAFMANGEGLPLVVLESMLHGCVPVVGRGTPMVELLERGKYGLEAKESAGAVAAALQEARRRLQSENDWPRAIATQARATTLTWPEAIEACAGHVTRRMGLSERVREA